MSFLRGDPALRLLARRKLLGTFRRALRRAKTAKGALLSMLGLVLLVLWMGTLLGPTLAMGRRPADPELFAIRVAAWALPITMLSLASGVFHRGLYLPKDEIERLFSAPVARADLVRYRMLANAGRNVFGGVILGVFAALKAPHPAFGFFGVMIGVQTLPVLNQLVAITLGSFENRVGRWLKRVSFLQVVVVLLFSATIGVFVFMSMTGADPRSWAWWRRLSGERGSPLDLPFVRGILVPFMPWAHAIAASSLSSFAAWFALAVAIHVLLFEVTARLPVDFRELSLATSAQVAERLARARRGGGAAAGGVTKSAVGWRVPWLFGRSPSGAVAWRKTASILRKSKSALITSLVLLGLLCLIAQGILRGEDGASSAAGLLVVLGLGTMYLCGGLRFDFREDLERMEVLRAWPIAPANLFFAMLVPEVALVALLLDLLALGWTAAYGGGFVPLPLVLLYVPLLVFAWVAIDNAAFLFAPVRFVPGQEGMLQNAGRAMAMMFVRFAAAGVVALVCVGSAWLVYWVLGGSAGDHAALAIGVGVAVLFLLTLAIDVGLFFLGGLVLSRFDVSRDRG